MTQTLNPMEIYKLLDQSNCGECGEKTCLAFAGAVFKGQKRLSQCPYINQKTLERYPHLDKDKKGPEPGTEENMYQALQELKKEIPGVDLSQAAERIQGTFQNHRLTAKIMGKDFSVDTRGNLDGEIHINPWVGIPFLQYVLHGEGRLPRGEWVHFRELPGGRARAPLFEQRCEKPLKRVAASYPDLFFNILDLFDAREVNKHFQADVSFLLYPLPLVPMLLCYWHPEDDMEADLHLFLDVTAHENLGIDGIFALGVGLATMLEKLALRHGAQGFLPLEHFQ